jgi:hypothetical protein
VTAIGITLDFRKWTTNRSYAWKNVRLHYPRSLIAPKRFAGVDSFSRYRYMDRSVPAFNHDALLKITNGKRLKIQRAQRERSLDVQNFQIIWRLRSIVRVVKAERDYKVDTDRNISVKQSSHRKSSAPFGGPVYIACERGDRRLWRTHCSADATAGRKCTYSAHLPTIMIVSTSEGKHSIC